MSILMYHLPTYEHTLQRDRTRRLQHTVRSHATTKHALPIEYYGFITQGEHKLLFRRTPSRHSWLMAQSQSSPSKRHQCSTYTHTHKHTRTTRAFARTHTRARAFTHSHMLSPVCNASTRRQVAKLQHRSLHCYRSATSTPTVRPLPDPCSLTRRLFTWPRVRRPRRLFFCAARSISTQSPRAGRAPRTPWRAPPWSTCVQGCT